MWLIIFGEQREQISLTVAYQSFRQRFDVEHLHRFSKQRLLMTKYQTPEVKHEENWIRLVMLAYVELWAARKLATYLPRPWERYQDTPNHQTLMSPSAVQRDFQRIISEIGKPGNSPKHRGIAPGRSSGKTQTKRTPQPVVESKPKSLPTKQEAA